MRIFQSTLPARGATVRAAEFGGRAEPFQSTLPARGATRGRGAARVAGDISIHAPRTGSDNCAPNAAEIRHNFNPRSPHGERPRGTFTSDFFIKFQSTLPARGATRTGISPHCISSISIHAPRTGSDEDLQSTRLLADNFNPRSPHGERPALSSRANICFLFQSTLPARGATSFTRCTIPPLELFQSTLPARGATRLRIPAAGNVRISIHAPRTGSDRHAEHQH